MRVQHARNVLDRQRQRDQQQVADDARDDDRQHDPPWHAAARIHRLLRHARRRVVSGKRPLRLQQADDERPPVRPALRVGGDAGEHEPDRLLRRDDQHRADDRTHADDMDRDAEVVEARHQPDPDVVDHRMREQDRRVDRQHIRGRRLQPDERRHKQRAAVIDAGQRRELSDNVEPGGEPAPAFAAEPARPVIHRAGGRHRRGELRHADRDRQREHADQRPPERHLRRPAHHQAVRIERHGAGQDGDDRKRNGEVREAAHGAEQLLRVAERVQLLDVVGLHSATPDRRVSAIRRTSRAISATASDGALPSRWMPHTAVVAEWSRPALHRDRPPASRP